ncbi:OmpP1/FadL family transporter [Sulfurimonas sp.]|uniref:OmpP1/FadL family transporter n=1 Tax=Sulfurimonas sp. TaxID=2022749 RepID=UPI002615BB49|nr:outer membrane protein transport protein [Sulfurimonas sp.]MDD5157666.1 outer membrane protein transport protein [Sulfurimonas sp.]
MKRTIKLAVVAALALGATSAFATNGSVMIGMGAKTRGMGGTGIGVSHGAESALSNPAMITKIKSDNEISFGGTVFMPDVSTSTSAGGNVESNSAADMFVIPSVSVASKVNDNFYFGVGMWGTGGLGVDYRESTDPTLMNMTTSLQLMQFGVPLAYTTNGFAVAITPIVQYGSLDINYNHPLAGNVGTGVADDLAFGYNLGLSYTAAGLTLGAVYISEIEMNFDNVLSTAVGAMTSGGYTNNKLSSPAQYGVGASYKMDNHTLAIDYRRIMWSDAETYKDFSWEDQNVMAIGYEYATTGWALRAGYQYAKSAIQNNANSAALTGGPANLGNTFNQLGFPGSEETHITFGGTVNLNKTLSLDLAAVYGLENETTTGYFGGGTITTKHSESSYSAQLNYNF